MWWEFGPMGDWCGGAGWLMWWDVDEVGAELLIPKI